MPEKQDVLLSVLKERIAQLETELENSNDRLLATLEEKDELVKEMEDLRSEAHEVVGQWEKEAADLRNKLELQNFSISQYVAMVKEKDDAKKEVEAKAHALEELSSTYSVSIVTLQQQLSEAKQSQAHLQDELTKTRSEWTEMSQRVREYEKSTVDMKDKVKELNESSRSFSQDIQKLHALLSDSKRENVSLKATNNQATLQVQQLMNRIEDLKKENEKVCQNSEMLQQRYTALQTELQSAKSLLVEKENCLSKFASENSELALLNENLKNRINDTLKRVESLEGVSQQQLEIISGYEKDIDEFKDTCIARCNIIDDLRSKTERLEEELTGAMRSRKELEIQFTTMKESYSALLAETNEAKIRSENTINELQREIDFTRNDSTRKIMLAEGKFDVALRSVEELITSLHSAQVRELLASEQEGRYKIELSFQNQLQLLKDQFVTLVLSELQDLKRQNGKIRLELYHASSEKDQSLSTTHTLKEQLSEANSALHEQRKICASLEQGLSDSNAMVKASQAKTNALEENNLWLKNQVEAMRQELGSLDELLNASLNEMREDNERLQIENQTIQELLKRLKEERLHAEEKAGYMSRELNTLKEELATQTRTLNITEGHLRSSNLQLEGLNGTLNEMKSRLDAQEKAKNDLLNSNTVLLSKLNSLKERTTAAEAAQDSIVNEKQGEIARLKAKINDLTRRCQDGESNLTEERKKHLETRESFNDLKESVGRMRNRFDELRERCGSDANSIKHLLAERDDFLKEKDAIVEKYNTLHEAFVKVRKESTLKMTEELGRLIQLGTTQEKELQSLRNENIILKKSVSMLSKSSPKSETILIEKLNLSEGPLRHPKKLSVAKDSK